MWLIDWNVEMKLRNKSQLKDLNLLTRNKQNEMKRKNVANVLKSEKSYIYGTS